MEEKEKKIGIEEIQNIKMTVSEKTQILESLLSTPHTKQEPIKSPYSFVSFFQRNHLAYYAMAICLVIILSSGGIYFKNQARENTRGLATIQGLDQINQNSQNQINTNNTKSIASPTPSSLSKKIAQNTNNNENGTGNSNVSSRVMMMPPASGNQTNNISIGLKNVFEFYKNGQISECHENGQTYYSASLNAYDGEGATFDIDGNIVGQYQGLTGAYTGINPKSCKIIYVVYPNIWGLDAYNEYNLN
ncbi:MAG: hypothetical protein WCI93_02830 [bacterium]